MFENDLMRVQQFEGPLTSGPLARWQRKANESSQESALLSCSLNNGSGPLTSGPLARGQRKANESSQESAFLSCSLNNASASVNRCGSNSKTPMKNGNASKSKTPNHTPGGSKAKTPGKGNKTPRSGKTPTALGDRFIPNRSSTQFDVGHFLVAQQSALAAESENSKPVSPMQAEYQRVMKENVTCGAASSRILSYANKPPKAPEGYQNSLTVLYSQGRTPNTITKATRHIPSAPERILDAPEIIDDYYLNLLDWSAGNMLAVGLGAHIYLWNAGTGVINQLFELEGAEDYISSVSFVKDGNFIAVGTSNAEVQIWDVVKMKRMRVMAGHTARVGALAWNSFILSSGSRSGNIHQHDVRVANHHVGTMAGHTQEICGLSWSPDGRYLASGGNDNILNIWPSTSGVTQGTQPAPVHTFTQHQAAVKALAWCPWQSSLLASGGGTADRHIRFWNCNTGACVGATDTKSQVCGLVWSEEHKELISGHGYANNELVIWKYPTMTRIAELTGHTSRILNLALSPDGSTVVSSAADETLRLWKCFAADPQQKKLASTGSSQKAGLLARGIR